METYDYMKKIINKNLTVFGADFSKKSGIYKQSAKTFHNYFFFAYHRCERAAEYCFVYFVSSKCRLWVGKNVLNSFPEDFELDN